MRCNLWTVNASIRTVFEVHGLYELYGPLQCRSIGQPSGGVSSLGLVSNCFYGYLFGRWLVHQSNEHRKVHCVFAGCQNVPVLDNQMSNNIMTCV